MGVILRVYPRLWVYDKRLDQAGLWRQIRWATVVHIALTNTCPKAVLVASTADAPTDGGAIVAGRRLDRTAATQTEGD